MEAMPEEALREALLNAIAHRDYFVTGVNILGEIFSDRLEIANPGGLVKGLTIKDLGKRSLSRNNLLFGLLQRMALVEKVGSGIIRMKNAMKEYGIKGPRFDINENWFTIIFNRLTEKWLETTQKIMSLIKERFPLILNYVGELSYEGRPFLGLEAYCFSRKEKRNFRVDRILK